MDVWHCEEVFYDLQDFQRVIRSAPIKFIDDDD